MRIHRILSLHTLLSCKLLLFIEIFCSMHSVSCNNAWRHALAALFSFVLLCISRLSFPHHHIFLAHSTPNTHLHAYSVHISESLHRAESGFVHEPWKCLQHGRPYEARVGREEGEEWEERGRAMPSGAIFLGFPGSHRANAPNASRKIVPHAG